MTLHCMVAAGAPCSARMNRRKFLLSASGLAAHLVTAGAAHASFEDSLSSRLRREGYRIVTRKRTWLGRIRIVAVRSLEEREVVLDPSTGEILRDYSTSIAAATSGPSGRDRSNRSGTSRGDGPGEPTADDRDEEPDEADDRAAEEEARERAAREAEEEARERARHEEELDAER